jgi:carboxyl-terminal processing protease
LALGLAALSPLAARATPPAADPAVAPPTALAEVTTRAWADARNNDAQGVIAALRALPGEAPGAAVRSSAEALERNLAKRETLRSEKISEVEKKLTEQLAKDGADALSEALKHAVELFTLRTDKAALKAEPRIVTLIDKAAQAAREAESRGEWFIANELFFRLNTLMEEEGTFKADVRRLGLRLSMIRLYAPEEFWKLRNDERIKTGKSPLPPYNGLGESYTDKIDRINQGMVKTAIVNASAQQIDRKPLRDVLAGGVEALRTFATTTDLQRVFAGLGDRAKRDALVAFLDSWSKRLSDPTFAATRATVDEFVTALLAENAKSINVPDNALLHELGNGAMARLDEFSAIIWPDELARFERMTQGNFRGVGVQIQIDEATQLIKVVTPLEGTPAQRAGVKAGDLIKKIDGKSAVGISLNQAVDLITGPVDTRVMLTMERETGQTDADGKALTQEIDFDLVRAVIPVTSVKGWKRTGAREDAWDWFIDPAGRIGYVRLLQFTDDTTRDLHAAIGQMTADGPLAGLILDLRFNPGGLLTEAVSVANTFIDKGLIVSTEGTMPGERREAAPDDVLLRDVPLAVLINEGSASASEIVAGAIKHYADKGQLNAIVVGDRSFGKGSVQNVWPLTNRARVKITTQYYKLPDGRILHRKPGAATWGVDPHLKVEMLLDTVADALKLRQDADVLPIDENGKVVVDPKTPAPDPRKLIDDGLDVQLHTALVLLQSKAAARAEAEKAHAQR